MLRQAQHEDSGFSMAARKITLWFGIAAIICAAIYAASIIAANYGISFVL
jgi:hypothetical protein